MKIIGLSDNTFILEAKKDEVLNLVGYYSIHSDGAPKVTVGSEILVSPMFRQLYELRRNNDELKKVADTLRGIASLLELQNPLKQFIEEKKEA